MLVRRLFLLTSWTLLLSCALIKPPVQPALTAIDAWTGRLSVRTQTPQASSPSAAFSAQFDLQGSSQAGALQLFSALGATLAEINWKPGQARLRSRGQSRDFADLDALMVELLGVNLPAQALFAWLRGESLTPAGWEVDLSAHASGRIAARKVSEPQAQFTLLFEPQTIGVQR